MEQILEKTRYTDTELNDFKILIQHKLQIAREELGELLGALNSSNSNGDDINIFPAKRLKMVQLLMKKNIIRNWLPGKRNLSNSSKQR